jgi:hypothetical protein
MKPLGAYGNLMTPTVTKTYAENGADLRSCVLSDVNFVLGKRAWNTSVPLISGNHRELLQLALDAGVETDSITSHGITDGESPVRGVVPPSRVHEAALRIELFDQDQSRQLRISLTFTIGTSNLGRERLRGFRCWADLGIDILWRNKHCDDTLDHPERMLDRNQIANFYAMARESKDELDDTLALSVSEDFRLSYVNVMDFRARVGNCVADNLIDVLFPTVCACPQLCNMPVGTIGNGMIAWARKQLETLRGAKMHADYAGCIACSWSN